MAEASSSMKARGSTVRNPSGTRYTAMEWLKGYAAWIAVLPIYIVLWLFAALSPKLPKWLHTKLLRAHYRETMGRKPDVRIPGDLSIAPYMKRWWSIKRNAFFNVYYHVVLRSDADTPHDHPWWSFSVVLEGGYWEHTVDGKRTWYGPGSVRFRYSGKFAHRLELQTNDYGEMHVKTIFITGPVLRRWGFLSEDGWIDAYDWDAYLDAQGINAMRMQGYAEQNAAR